MFYLVPLDFPLPLDPLVLTSIERAISLSESPHFWTIHLAVLEDDVMQTLNLQYRWIDSTTDVLSFHYFDSFEANAPEDVVGEIVFSASRIAQQAQEFGHSEEHECYRLLVHGIFHILGYDHETDEDYVQMWEQERRVLCTLMQEHKSLNYRELS